MRTQIGDGSEEEEIYKENILDHYKKPRNFGRLDNADFVHKELNPLCGDSIEISLKVNKNKIKDIKFDGHGCAISRAAMSMLTEKIKGMNVEDVLNLNHDDIMNMLGIKIGVVRMKCALLSLKTLHNALNKVQSENEK